MAQAENTYYNINGSFVSVAAGSASATIGLISVDASRNPNFKTFGIAITATSFTITTAATAAGKTITVTYVGYTNASTTINVAYT
ncbi:MAG: hypothetical protein LHV68_09060 [Elusimicrobia bacterium]|nr:hypothetical protein [Candidatus Liberimonas magnetica]